MEEENNISSDDDGDLEPRPLLLISSSSEDRSGWSGHRQNRRRQENELPLTSRFRRACGIVAAGMAILVVGSSFSLGNLSTLLRLPSPHEEAAKKEAGAVQLKTHKNRTKNRPHRPPVPPQRPDLGQLIGDFDSNITGNVSWLLDFAILGHAKCGTSFHVQWLYLHPEILMQNREIFSLRNGHPAEMVSFLYGLDGYDSWRSTLDSPSSSTRKRGYKSPADILSPLAVHSIRQYWPGAKLLVGVRHPVEWFESLYNFKQMTSPAETMALPEDVYFHVHLSYLGKTNATTDPHEQHLLATKSRMVNNGDVPRKKKRKNKYLPDYTPMSNPVLLYDPSQLSDPTEGRDAIYRSDLQQFLGLSVPLNARPAPVTNHHTVGLHICDEKYHDLRSRLVQVGTDAAEWILTYFLPHPDVTVSSPERFRELLATWSTDPCNTTKNTSSAADEGS